MRKRTAVLSFFGPCALVVATLAWGLFRDPLASPAPLAEMRWPGSLSWDHQWAFCGDFDGDGGDDVVSGSDGFDDLAVVYSGSSGARIVRIEDDRAIGEQLTRVARGPESSGRPTVLLGNPRLMEGRGLVQLFDGDGGRLWEATGGPGLSSFGQCVASCPDVDGDLVQDVLAGSEQCICILSGSDGQELARIGPPEGAEAFAEAFAEAVRSCWDIDGDGLRDIAVGGGMDEDLVSPIWVFSGATHELLAEGHEEHYVLDGPARIRDGLSPPKDPTLLIETDVHAVGHSHLAGADVRPTRVPVGDFDGDGLVDAAFILWEDEELWFDIQSRSRVEVVSGADGRTLFSKRSSCPIQIYAGGGDVDGNGTRDLLIDGKVYGYGGPD